MTSNNKDIIEVMKEISLCHEVLQGSGDIVPCILNFET
jgi:hypothetical protein